VLYNLDFPRHSHIRHILQPLIMIVHVHHESMHQHPPADTEVFYKHPPAHHNIL